MRLEDEVIQDSEDEEMFAPLRIPGPSTMETEAREAAKASKARPRPRPAYKGALAKVAAASEANGQAAAPAPTTPPTGSDATRPTNPQDANPSTSSTVVDPKAAPAATEDLDEFSLDIAERAKLRSRARSSKVNAKQQPRPVDPDVIDISSSDEDLNIRPPNRGPKAKAADRDVPSPKKRAKKTHIPVDIALDDTSSAIIPIATSDLSSQLPPSDPPLSTPLESTPANARPMIGSSPLSSPLPPPPRPPKRKRKTLPELPNDSDDGDSVKHRGALRKEDSGLAMPPPPPPFFAGSSSSSSAHVSDTLVETLSSTRASDGPAAPKSAKAKGKRKVIDDDDFEDDWPIDPPIKPKPRQRKKSTDEDDWQGDEVPKPARKSRKSAADEEDEGEWAGDAPPKRKPRAPPKKKGKKDGVPKQVVEVVIEQTRGGRKGRKGKNDPPQSVEDVARNTDVVQGRASVDPDAAVPEDLAGAKDGLSPLSDLEVESGTGNKQVARQSTPPPVSKPSIPVLRDGESILNSPRSKSKAKGKKRAIMDSDEEENNDGEEPGSPPKKPRREPTKGRKSAPAALEQENEDQEDDEPGSSHRVRFRHVIEFT
ncbi:uncharacterized protein B0H18DRAFT_958944 [Fomitopsis serialis]|uniref:uncharacterized protein n=1 Tax=Fomitopsis serialis TaxID=139415 RepID=UPI0020074AE2|nr:uncharacterized protein B0H18DRAFT_958944 [Neoantrodia serialis]KAH9916167.1 hypothetical protein B0H18DRAFT_958944 [Neoantrodia serialis]